VLRETVYVHYATPFYFGGILGGGAVQRLGRLSETMLLIARSPAKIRPTMNPLVQWSSPQTTMKKANANVTKTAATMIVQSMMQ
jgi:hypothetical protein